MKFVTLIVSSLMLLTSPSLAEVLVIDGGTVHPVSGEPFVGQVVVEDGRIAAVGARISTPRDATTIEARGLHVYPGLFDAMSSLGLIEMTRQREHESLRDTMYGACPYCNGKGRILSEVSMSAEIQRRLREQLIRNGRSTLRVMVHSQILERLRNDDAGLLESLEEEFKGELSFRSDDSLHLEEYRIINTKNDTVVAFSQPQEEANGNNNRRR